MGKQGPCYHCGVTSTPLWRNGPPEKPVLCNACGSRWRTKGTLLNYTPLHSRAEHEDIEDQRTVRTKGISLISKGKDFKLLKRKQEEGRDVVIGEAIPNDGQNFQKLVVDEDAGNRSSSGSAISNSESWIQFGGPECSDLTGPAQSVVWDTTVPSRKRTCVSRPKQSAVEKLTRDLYSILQEQQSSCFSGTSEEDLLLESETPMVSVEIGHHGSVLFRHPNDIVQEELESLPSRNPKVVAREEESEASSLSVENKVYRTSDVYSIPINKTSKALPIPEAEKLKGPPGPVTGPGNLVREKLQHEKGQVLSNSNSPLCQVDLGDVVNFEEFTRNLSYKEQQQLSKFLHPLDVSKPPESLKEMFCSSEFKENLTSFQQLLAEGVFEISLSGEQAEDCKALRKLALSSFAKWKWVELRQRLNVREGPVTSKLGDGNRLEGIQKSNYPDIKVPAKNPKRAVSRDSDSSCFSPKSLFAVPSDGSSLMLNSVRFTDGNSEQDLLFDVPSNGSFPQAELLLPSGSVGP